MRDFPLGVMGFTLGMECGLIISVSLALPRVGCWDLNVVLSSKSVMGSVFCRFECSVLSSRCHGFSLR